jgi:hypothetical protein
LKKSENPDGFLIDHRCVFRLPLNAFLIENVHAIQFSCIRNPFLPDPTNPGSTFSNGKPMHRYPALSGIIPSRVYSKPAFAPAFMFAEKGKHDSPPSPTATSLSKPLLSSPFFQITTQHQQ